MHMARCHQGNGYRQMGPTSSQPHRVLYVAVLAFFCFPITRFYLSAQLTSEHCLELEHSHARSSAVHTHHSHSELLPPARGDGFFFQHCKDTYNGIALSPVQPLGVPVLVSFEPPQILLRAIERTPAQLPESLPPFFFHPPRHLA